MPRQPTAHLSVWSHIPWLIPACAVLLMLMGLSGIERGDTLSRLGEFYSRQIIWVGLACGVLLLTTLCPYRSLRAYSGPLFCLSLILLVVVFVFPPRWGSRRWIPLGLMQFQPSEMMKLAYLLLMSSYLMNRPGIRTLRGLIVPFVLTLLPVALILKEPDLGTALLFIPMLFAMLFTAGARVSHLLLVIVTVVAISPLLWKGMSAEQRSRITAVFQQQDGGPAPRGDGYHLHQSKQVLALGGAWGSELTGQTSDDPLAYYLPACRTDFVLCMIGERWGVGGTMFVLLLYLVLIGRGLLIAGTTREPFGRQLVVGCIALIAAQVIINCGMTVGLMPITGITLPLVSYGGSSLLFTAASIGLLINVGMRSETDPGWIHRPAPKRLRSSTRLAFDH